MKMSLLEALQKCGKVTLILSTGYYSYSTQHHCIIRGAFSEYGQDDGEVLIDGAKVIMALVEEEDEKWAFI